MQKALKLYREINDRNGVADSLNNLGLVYESLGEWEANVYGDLGEYSKAIDYSQQSLAIYQEIGDRSDEAKSLNNLANVYQILGEYGKAIEYYQQSLTIYQEIGDYSEVVSCLINIAENYELLEQEKEALSFYQKALSVNLKYGENELLIVNKQPKLALSFYQKALIIFQQLGELEKQAQTLTLISGLYISGIPDENNYWQRDYDRAFQLLDQVINIYKQIGDQVKQAEIYEIKGLMFRSLATGENFDNSFAKFEFLYSQELDLSTNEEIDDQLTKKLYWESIDNLKIAYSLIKNTNLHEFKVRILTNLGEVNILLGKNQEAVENLTLALNLLDKNKNYQEYEIITRLLGDAHRNLQQYRLALDFYLIALEIREKYKLEIKSGLYDSEHQMLERIAETYIYLEKYQEALEFIEKYVINPLYDPETNSYYYQSIEDFLKYIADNYATGIDNEIYIYEVAYSLNIIALAYKGLGDTEKALEILELSSQEMGLNGRGAGEEEDSTIIETLHNDALGAEYDIRQLEDNLLAKAESFIYRADIYQELGKTDKASKFYQLALDIFQRLEDQDKVNQIEEKINSF